MFTEITVDDIKTPQHETDLKTNFFNTFVTILKDCGVSFNLDDD